MRPLLVSLFDGFLAVGFAIPTQAVGVLFDLDPIPDQGPPVGLDDEFFTYEGTGTLLDVLDNDTTPDPFRLYVDTIVSGPSSGTVTIIDGPPQPDGEIDPEELAIAVVYEPNPGFLGTDTFVYRVTDGGPDTDEATVTVHVLEYPNAVDDAATTQLDTVTIDVLPNDYTPSAVGHYEIEVVSGPSNGATEVNSDQTITYTPSEGFEGNDSFVYKLLHVGVPGFPEPVNDDATVTIIVGEPCTFTSSGDDLICGTDGADTLRGGRGDDELDGGPGPDRLIGGPGDDELIGGEGFDVLIGGRGTDYLDGGPGWDICIPMGGTTVNCEIVLR